MLDYELMINYLFELKGTKGYRPFATEVGLNAGTLYNIMVRKHKPSHTHTRIINEYISRQIYTNIEGCTDYDTMLLRLSDMCFNNYCVNCSYYDDINNVCRIKNTFPQNWKKFIKE